MSSPQNGETRGSWLWRKMHACFGSRFLDMWASVDQAEMEHEWSLALRGITRENLQRGVAAMYQRRTPPTLGEFLALCEPVPQMYRQHVLPALTDQTRASPDVVEANLARMREILKPLTQPKQPGIAWAYRLLARADAGEPITLHQIAFAQEAIANWKRSHGQHGNREPGSDDE
ncbi:hypothetical protein [Paraburkholderia sp. 35.1]|uniref:hypothetical protein n=1 Tax=Paraburkholderia sp. 35.1 TaxID=2991058 RepID=UPI003D20436F